ncbi:hypothetical protein [Kribbella sp. NPDC051718]|uniref:hypothetical protein n=1 Tax=Kribbella sp. NPDC051718 TaxID=3155168 RepID=UPI0034331DA6
MTSRDLKDLLQTMAADGTDRVSVDEHELVPRIRSRRRRRAGVAAAVAASTAVVVAAGAYAVLPGGADEQPPVAAPPQPTVTLKPSGPSVLDCGSTFTAPIIGNPSLKLDVSQTEVVRDGPGKGAPLDIQLTNTTDKTLDLFGTRYGPAITLVKDGVVVSTSSMETLAGQRWKYEAGKTVTQKVFIDTFRCNTNGVPNSTEQLAPGTYQAYATKSFTQTTGASQSKVLVAGGPWTIELK